MYCTGRLAGQSARIEKQENWGINKIEQNETYQAIERTTVTSELEYGSEREKKIFNACR